MISLVLALLLAQEPTTFRTTVPVVMVPVTVTDRAGKHINGLGPEHFLLLDDGVRQRFAFDTADTIEAPLAVVIAVQANNTAPAAVRKIQKVGSMIEPLITGERGRAAVLAFGAEVQVVQDFTNDAGELTKAFRALKTQSGKQARMLDAIHEGVRLL
jgi:VWFA-related protein